MTIRFAAARPSMTAFIGRTYWTLDLPPAGNDNCDALTPAAEDAPAAPTAARDPLREALLLRMGRGGGRGQTPHPGGHEPHGLWTSCTRGASIVA